jgi:hypothetical protein
MFFLQFFKIPIYICKYICKDHNVIFFLQKIFFVIKKVITNEKDYKMFANLKMKKKIFFEEFLKKKIFFLDIFF